jgi:hypothetical protein
MLFCCWNAQSDGRLFVNNKGKERFQIKSVVKVGGHQAEGQVAVKHGDVFAMDMFSH